MPLLSYEREQVRKLAGEIEFGKPPNLDWIIKNRIALTAYLNILLRDTEGTGNASR